MDEDPVDCPPLSLSQHNGNIVLSTFENAVGTLVTFLCQGPDDFLSGTPALQCTRNGKWNGTVPMCLKQSETTYMPDLSTKHIDDTVSTSTELPPTASSTETEVETVVLLLWCVGGLLLLTLLVLMMCIVRSHRKGVQHRANVLNRTRGRGNQSHGGGVNQGFSSYDEIWTWIPVVRDNQANCTSQINPSARRNTTPVVTSSASQERTLLSTLRLPTYNEAVRGTPNASRAQNQNNRSEQTTIPQVPNRGQRVTPEVNRQCNRTVTSAQISCNTQTVTQNSSHSAQSNQNSAGNNTTTTNSENHYDTIPVYRDRALPAVPINQSNASNSNNVSHVSVTSASGVVTSVTSAHVYTRQTSSYNAHAQPVVSASVQSPRPDTRRQLDFTRHDNAIIIRAEVENSTRNTPNNAAIARVAMDTQHTNELIRSAYSIYPYYSRGCQHSEFQHSDNSAFSQYGPDTTRCIRTTIPPHPISHQPRDQRHTTCTVSSEVNGTLGVTPSAPFQSMESEYF